MEVSRVAIPTVAKLKIKGTEDNAYVIAHWDGDIGFKIIYNDQHWNSKFTTDEITYFHTNLCLTKEEYMMSTKKALSVNSGTEFVYRIENDKFFWEKIVNVEKNLKVIHGAINLTDICSQGGMEILVDTLLGVKQSMEDELSFKEEEGINISKNLAGLVDRFKNYTFLKNEMENDLYEKFTTILNSKKHKIDSLEDFLKEIKAGKQTIPVSRKKKTTLLPISDSDST